MNQNDHGKSETGSNSRVKSGITGRRLGGLVAGTAAGAAAGTLIGNTMAGPIGAVVGGALCAMLGALLGHATAEAMWPTMGDLYSMRTPSRIESRPSGPRPPLAPPGRSKAYIALSEARLPARSNSSKETR
jgi:predicted lipid-binding transport protein (Tim44 family)